MQNRFMDGRLVEVALTPDEAEGVRINSKFMRETPEWLKGFIAHEDFDGAAAIAAIDRALRHSPDALKRSRAAAPRET